MSQGHSCLGSLSGTSPLHAVLDRKAQTDSKMTRDAFTYDAERDAVTCPQGHDLPLRTVNTETRVKPRPRKAGIAHCGPIARMHLTER